MKTFGRWLEEKLEQRNLKHALLDALQLAKNALDGGNDVPIRMINLNRLKEKISSLGLTPEDQEKLINYAITQKDGGTLKGLLAMVDADDIESQDTTSSRPAVLPQGTQPAPKPLNTQQRQQQQQMGQGF
jgi:hypothetical protein